MWVDGVVEYMSDSWYWWCCHTEGQCGLLVKWNTCQTLGTGGVTILRVSVGYCCSGVHVRPLVLYWWCYHTEGQCGLRCSGVPVRLLVLVVLPY